MSCLSAEWGSTKTGEQEQLIATALNCVLRVPRYIPQEQRFDIRVLVRQPGTKQHPLIVIDGISRLCWNVHVGLIWALCSVYQGLGLLINLVEYSSRNRHCLVDMEYHVDDTCLEDSLMQPADPTQSDTASEASAPSTAEARGDEAEKPKASGALAALVKVRVVPRLISEYFSSHYVFPSWLPERFSRFLLR